MIAAALLALVLVAIGLLVAITALVWLVVYLVRSRREESCCEDCDDWMDIADVVSDEHAAGLLIEGGGDFYDTDDETPPWGYTDLEWAAFRRNYLPMTDPERCRLDAAFKSITNNYEGV